MGSVTNAMNREIIGFINHVDKNPEQPRPVTFWFYSECEKKIYKLAACLKENSYTIHACGKSASGKYLCIAETELYTSIELLDRMCVDMQILAERKGVIFDGWETVIDISNDEH